MQRQVTIRIDGRPTTVVQGTTVAAAIAASGHLRFGQSTSGQARGPFCGMGICAECCVTIDGQTHCRSCLMLCVDGMEVRTDD